jgi:hypothetical protein
MPEPPRADRRGENQQPKDLIAPEQALLGFSRIFPGLLLGIRLDALFDH